MGLPEKSVLMGAPYRMSTNLVGEYVSETVSVTHSPVVCPVTHCINVAQEAVSK